MEDCFRAVTWLLEDVYTCFKALASDTAVLRGKLLSVHPLYERINNTFTLAEAEIYQILRGANSKKATPEAKAYLTKLLNDLGINEGPGCVCYPLLFTPCSFSSTLVFSDVRPISSKYSKLLYTQSPRWAVDDDDSSAQVPGPEDNAAPEVPATERKRLAEEEVRKNLMERFFLAGAVFQATSAMLAEVRWRVRLDRRRESFRWSWTELPSGAPGAFFFDDLLVAATFAYRQYEAMWRHRMKLGPMDAANLNAQRIQQALTVQKERLAAHAWGAPDIVSKQAAEERRREDDDPDERNGDESQTRSDC